MNVHKASLLDGPAALSKERGQGLLERAAFHPRKTPHKQAQAEAWRVTHPVECRPPGTADLDEHTLDFFWVCCGQSLASAQLLRGQGVPLGPRAMRSTLRPPSRSGDHPSSSSTPTCRSGICAPVAAGSRS